LAKIRPFIEQAADPELATYLNKVKEEYEQLSPQQRINDWHTFIDKPRNLAKSVTVE